ncbi:MAG: hypothetical protein JXA78_15255 [Anaerolineales bacterium]|nr:hypothetical protein [Anaerolineales bacterium]
MDDEKSEYPVPVPNPGRFLDDVLPFTEFRFGLGAFRSPGNQGNQATRNQSQSFVAVSGKENMQ